LGETGPDDRTRPHHQPAQSAITTNRPPKSTGRPPKSTGRPPKSTGRPPKSLRRLRNPRGACSPPGVVRRGSARRVSFAPGVGLQTRWPAAGHPQSPRLAPGGFYGEGTGSERSEVPVPVLSPSRWDGPTARRPTRLAPGSFYSRAASGLGAAAHFALRAVSVSLKIRSNSARVRAVTACTSLTSSAGRS